VKSSFKAFPEKQRIRGFFGVESSIKTVSEISSAPLVCLKSVKEEISGILQVPAHGLL
jgi:hypothetical protein